MTKITTISKLQKGFSLITAVFLLVVLASLGALMVPFVTTQQQSSAVDVIGAQMNQAARAGIEWGAYQVLQKGSSGCFSSPATPSLYGTILSSVSNTVTPVTVTVSCTATSAIPDNETIYAIAASAVLNNAATVGSTNYIERDMLATIAASSVNTGIIYQSEN
jgi:MSHA biogenesis protein MshP